MIHKCSKECKDFQSVCRLHFTEISVSLSTAEEFAVDAKDWESSYHSEHDNLLRSERRVEKLEAELKEQTRLGVACHDELLELREAFADGPSVPYCTDYYISDLHKVDGCKACEEITNEPKGNTQG